MHCSRRSRVASCMQAIDAGRQQYAELLADLGFVPSAYASAASAAGRGRRGGSARLTTAATNPYGGKGGNGGWVGGAGAWDVVEAGKEGFFFMLRVQCKHAHVRVRTCCLS